MAATPNPMADTFPDGDPPKISQKTCLIAGIMVTILGLEELSLVGATNEVSCLWLLHPRLLSQESMQPFGRHAVLKWNAHQARFEKSQRRGMLAILFDQRNHGSRLQYPLANEAWRSGNPNHAPDMFSLFQGTALDTSQLITHLPSYVFPHSDRTITAHTVMGVSLGGYAAWHCLLHDERVGQAIIVVGCADYKRIMSDRARLSKRSTWVDGGKGFLGSKDFPKDLVKAVDQADPAALLMEGPGDSLRSDSNETEPSQAELETLFPLMKRHLGGKRIFNLAGGADKLVPYEASRPFLEWLTTAIRPGGWFDGEGVVLENKIYAGVGHAMSPRMRDDALSWLVEGAMHGKDVSKI